ncbi:hypothetical protein A6X21_16670 [Planctopirus hydrillae]|uniref:Uncharacterized protein n=1 Tax=Planctopirus hydrillae TaxID=1841610 RepID=A0A1C3EQG1_9PLAN|nr:hypothetical protein A6X21_16670 [Planctopirus hydrillae]
MFHCTGPADPLIQSVLLCAVTAGQSAGSPNCRSSLMASSGMRVVKPGIESLIEVRDLRELKDLHRHAATSGMMFSTIESEKIAKSA